MSSKKFWICYAAGALVLVAVSFFRPEILSDTAARVINVVVLIALCVMYYRQMKRRGEDSEGT